MADNYIERQYDAWQELKARRAKQAQKRKKAATKFYTRPGKPKDGEAAS